MVKLDKRTRKSQQWSNLQEACLTYSKCLFVNVDNVTSKQICVMRKALRAINAKMIMGKNTLMKAAIAELIEEPEEGCENYEELKAKWEPRPHLEIIREQLVLNTGLIFTNGDLSEIKAILDSQTREAPAKVGSLAPAEVTIPAGSTGLDPKQTSFFQALAIQTKIVKAQIEIVNPVHIISEGEKVSSSQAALLDKLKIRPFEYKMHILNVLDNGKIYPAAVLSISEEDLLSTFTSSAQNITALSLGSGYVIAPAAPHLIMNAFKNLASVTFASDYSFPQADKLKAAAAATPAVGGGAAATSTAPAKEEKVEEEVEEDVDMGDLFGGDDY